MMAETPLRCQRCKHAWMYTGKKKWVTSCPNCHTSVSISKNKVNT